MSKSLALLLLLPASALAAPVLTTTGACPGPVTITVTGGTPNGRVAFLTSQGTGSFAVPAGPCAGDLTGLNGSSTVFRGLRNLDATGSVTFTPTLGGPACSLVMQAIDVPSCQQSLVVPVGDVVLPATVRQIRSGAVPVDSEVELGPVRVTAKTTFGFFAQQDAQPNGGIYVFGGADWETTYGALSLGDVVEVDGRYIEYFDLTEISLPASTAPSLVVTGSGPVPPPTTLTVSALVAGAESYESMLVAVQNVTVTAAPNQFNEWMVGDGAAEVMVDDIMHLPAVTPLVSDAFSLVRGPLYYSFGAYKIEPRDATDVVPAP
jgi:hypothetical protein